VGSTVMLAGFLALPQAWRAGALRIAKRWRGRRQTVLPVVRRHGVMTLGTGL
jgi:hypothetical protein